MDTTTNVDSPLAITLFPTPIPPRHWFRTRPENFCIVPIFWQSITAVVMWIKRKANFYFFSCVKTNLNLLTKLAVPLVNTYELFGCFTKFRISDCRDKVTLSPILVAGVCFRLPNSYVSRLARESLAMGSYPHNIHYGGRFTVQLCPVNWYFGMLETLYSIERRRIKTLHYTWSTILEMDSWPDRSKFRPYCNLQTTCNERNKKPSGPLQKIFKCSVPWWCIL